MYKLYKLNDFEKEMLSSKVYDYATKEFSLQSTIDLWHETMLSTIEKFKKKPKDKKWKILEI